MHTQRLWSLLPLTRVWLSFSYVMMLGVGTNWPWDVRLLNFAHRNQQKSSLGRKLASPATPQINSHRCSITSTPSTPPHSRRTRHNYFSMVSPLRLLSGRLYFLPISLAVHNSSPSSRSSCFRVSHGACVS